jgi:hypothetical protein
MPTGSVHWFTAMFITDKKSPGPGPPLQRPAGASEKHGTRATGSVIPSRPAAPAGGEADGLGFTQVSALLGPAEQLERKLEARPGGLPPAGPGPPGRRAGAAEATRRHREAQGPASRATASRQSTLPPDRLRARPRLRPSDSDGQLRQTHRATASTRPGQPEPRSGLSEADTVTATVTVTE